MAAAYACALQLLLSGVAAAHNLPTGDLSANDLFVICRGSGHGSTGDWTERGKPALPHWQCALCGATTSSCAVLPAESNASRVEAQLRSDVVRWNDARIIGYDSPTGQYQRGPPASALIFG